MKTESEKHLQAKLKLFNLLKENKLTLIDQYNTEYQLYKGKKGEFLYVEPIIFFRDNKPLLQNKNFPCLVSMAIFNKREFNPLCNFEINNNYVTALEKFPCYECLQNNFNISLYKILEEMRSHIIIPDIAYGYNGKYKVWIEILHMHKCSDHKRALAKLHKIHLLEISSLDIEKLQEGEKLKCNLINFMNKEEYKKYVSFTISKNRKGTEVKTIEQKKNNSVQENKKERKRILEMMYEKFNHIFEMLTIELENNNVSYESFLNLMYKKVIYNNYEKKKFDKLLKHFLRHKIKVSIIDFTSSFYHEETLKKFNIHERKILIINRQKAKEIMEFNDKITNKNQ